MVEAQSPGLPYSATLGMVANEFSNPNGVVAKSGQHCAVLLTQPRSGLIISSLRSAWARGLAWATRFRPLRGLGLNGPCSPGLADSPLATRHFLKDPGFAHFPRRGSIIQPRVAVLGYPGDGGERVQQPQRGCGEVWATLCSAADATPFGVDNIIPPLCVGSRTRPGLHAVACIDRGHRKRVFGDMVNTFVNDLDGLV